MKEKVRKETELDADGQPLYKEIQKAILAKQTAKYGEQIKD
jgi:hypothetical protein